MTGAILPWGYSIPGFKGLEKPSHILVTQQKGNVLIIELLPGQVVQRQLLAQVRQQRSKASAFRLQVSL